MNNTHTSRRWSEENPHATALETDVQLRFSVSVCCGIIDNQPICPVVLQYHHAVKSIIIIIYLSWSWATC
jgi:hypothetical protein